MITHLVDSERFDAFTKMLGQPDPADLPHRGHVLRCEGEPDRRSTRLPEILMAWLQRRHLGVDIEEPLASPRRASDRHGRSGFTGPRLVRVADTDERSPRARTA